MKPMTDSTLDAAETFGLVSKYRLMIIAGTGLCMALFVAASFVLPKKYKSHFTLSIYAKYYQNPLIRDFIPELNDAGEMKAQSQSLIRQALTPAFLDSLGVKYGIYRSEKGRGNLPAWLARLVSEYKVLLEGAGLYQPAKGGSEGDVARKNLLSRIQVLDLNATTFDVSVVYSDPEVTLQLTRDINAQVIQTLLDAHINNLVNIRDAIRKRLESLAFNMTSAPDPRATVRPQLVKEELAGIRSQIQALTTQFTEQHPAVRELRARENILSRWQGDAPKSDAAPASGEGNALMGSGSQEGVKDIYNDLMKKLNYLNIALEADRSHQGDYFAIFESPMYPEAPLWPKRSLMALWGMALGFVGSLTVAALREYFDRTTLRTRALAERIGVPFLGELPAVPWKITTTAENRN